MKKNIIYAIFAAVICLMQSCALDDFDPQTWAIEPELSFSNGIIIASSRGDVYTTEVYTNYENVNISTNSQAWCKADVVEEYSTDSLSKKIKVRVVLDNNQEKTQRTASIGVTISRGNKSLTKQISVFQEGGEWDVIEGLGIPVFWGQKLSDSQKSIISEQLRQLVFVKGGSMTIGCSSDVNSPNYSIFITKVNPLRTVTVSDFYMGKFEVTQDQWSAVMNSTNAVFRGGNLPIENMTFDEAMEYVTALSKLTGLNISLPTSAQWEYAARGGQYSMGYRFWAGGEVKNEVGHFIDSSVDENSPLFTTIAVGQKKPNELGLYDMSGNVSEICLDLYGEVDANDTDDPKGPSLGEGLNNSFHVERGGSFADGAKTRGWDFISNATSFYHSNSTSTASDSYAGIRIVLKR